VFRQVIGNGPTDPALTTGKNTMIRIQGILIPVAWDDAGRIAELGIETFGEEFYLIDPASDYSRIRTLLRRPVEITGRIIQAPGRKMVRIDRITPLEKTPAR
jgi:hypothetical protein